MRSRRFGTNFSCEFLGWNCGGSWTRAVLRVRRSNKGQQVVSDAMCWYIYFEGTYWYSEFTSYICIQSCCTYLYIDVYCYREGIQFWTNDTFLDEQIGFEVTGFDWSFLKRIDTIFWHHLRLTDDNMSCCSKWIGWLLLTCSPVKM